MELYDRKTAPTRADTWFVYALVDSRKPDDVRYIGITNNPRSRMSLHLSQAPKEGWRKSRWVQSVVSDGGDILMGIMDAGLSQDVAMAMEIDLIAHHRAIGSSLTNLTDGGEGVKGQIQSAETRAKKSAALKGRVHSEESIALRAERLRGRKASDEARANMSAAHLVRYKEPGARDRQRDGTIARFENPDERERYAELTRKRFERAGERERHSEIMRRVANDNPDIAMRRKRSQRLNGPQSNNKTGFKGVFFDKSRGKYIARIKDGATRHLGYFESAEEASMSYDCAAYAVWGDDCYLNYKNKLADAA